MSKDSLFRGEANDFSVEVAHMVVEIEQKIIYSAYLERDVIVDIYSPTEISRDVNFDLLLINDGQDLRTMNFSALINELVASGSIAPIVCVGIHCSADRMNEYGVVHRIDYLNRGAKAGLYSKFIFEELLPELKAIFGVEDFKQKSFAGFSLGALSAFDIVWNNPNEFAIAGVFSGALWWRRRGYEDVNYNAEKDRIIHFQVENGRFRSGLKFFFECGQLDETADRNNNGIIDSIDDTRDIIQLLKKHGYTDEEIFYLELEDGRHDVETWKRAFPTFLQWGWGKG